MKKKRAFKIAIALLLILSQIPAQIVYAGSGGGESKPVTYEYSTDYSSDYYYDAYKSAGHFEALGSTQLYDTTTYNFMSKSNASAGNRYSTYGKYENLYALVVTNGITNQVGDDGTTNALFISVKYQTVDGDKYEAVININNKGTSDYFNTLNYGYALSKKDNASSAFDATRTLADNLVGGYGSLASSISSINKEKRQAYNNDSYLFPAVGKISRIESVTVCGTSGMIWDMVSADIYSATVDDLEMLGYLSNEMTLAFSGERIAHCKPGANLGSNDNALSYHNAAGDYAYLPLGVTNSSDNPSVRKIRNIGTSEGYYIKLKIGDEHGSGIQKLYSIAQSDAGKINNPLTAEIIYGDTNNNAIHLSVPVIANALTYAASKGFVLGSTTAFAQDNDEILMYVTLPYCGEISSIKLTSPMSSDGSCALGDDAVYISGVEVYKSSLVPDSAVRLNTSHFGLSMDMAIADSLRGTDTDPLYYYSYTETPAGEKIAKNKDATFKLIRTGGQEASRDLTNAYLITITTNPNNSIEQSMGKPKISLFYKDFNNNDHSLENLDVEEMTKNFYGYWVDSKGNNAALLYGMYPGNSVSMLLELDAEAEPIAYFTDLWMNFPKGEEGSWSITHINVTDLYYLEKRVVDANTNTAMVLSDGGSLDRVVTRAYEGERILDSSAELLLKRNQTIKVALDEQQTDVVADTRDKSSQYYSLNYEDALKNQDFNEEACLYEVRVDVASQSTNAMETDACGSENLFYFQLSFAKGTSAYVLANEQLASDKFNQGTTAVFYISTNEDLGELMAINVLPCDKTINEDSHPTDKLCVDKISVIKHGNNGVGTKYTSGDIGWIYPQYSNTTDGKSTVEEGRTAAQLVHTYLLPAKSYMAQIEFALTTGEYNTEMMSSSALSFVGDMVMDIYYKNSKDENCSLLDIDVVKKIADYANKQVKINTSVSFIGNYLSDPVYMFNGNKTDRFTVDLDDVKSLTKVVIRAAATKDVAWNLKAFSAGVVTSKGTLRINNYSEYQKKYVTEPQEIINLGSGGNSVTASDGIATFPLIMTIIGGGVWSSADITFGENIIQIPTSDKETITALDKTPKSAEGDSINIQIYMAPGSSQMAGKRRTVKALLTYSISATSAIDRVTTAILEETTKKGADGKDRIVLYKNGVSVNDFRLFRNLQLELSSGMVSDGSSYYIEKCLIQHYRGNTVIDNYEVDVIGNLASGTVYSGANYTSQIKTGDKQVVMLALGELTTDNYITPLTHDVAVRLEYTSTQDVGMEGQPRKYHTPYVFFSDANYTKIEPGNQIFLNFDTSFVDEVTGIEIVPINDFKVAVSSVVISQYEAAGDELVLKKQLSYSGMGQIPSTGKTYSPETQKQTREIPVQISFTNSKDIGNILRVPGVVATLDYEYESLNGSIQSGQMYNIKRYIGNGTTLLAEEVTDTFTIVTNLNKFRTIKISLSDNSEQNLATWGIDMISINYRDVNGKEITVERSVSDLITEDNPLIIDLVEKPVSEQTVSEETVKEVIKLITDSQQIAPTVTEWN